MFIYKSNKQIYTDKEIIIIKPFDSNLEFAIDDKSKPLFDELWQGTGEVNGGVLKIGKSKIKLLDAPDLTIPTSPLTNEVELSWLQLTNAAKYVSNEQVLAGVFVNNLGTIIATDRYKLYTIFKGTNESGIVLPPAFIRALPQCNMVKLKYNTVRAECEIDGVIYHTRLLNSNKYPDVSRLIDTTGYNEVKFDIANYLAVGKLVGGDINLTIKDYTITFEGNDTYTDEYSENIVLSVPLSHLLPAYSTGGIKTVWYSGSMKPLIFDTVDGARIVVVTLRV